MLFWIVAPLAVLGALGLVIARKAVHGAMFLAVTMICLAVLYIALEAPFLGVVQIVVYTGAIMMLFLFVIMLVGVDASDSLVETIRGQRVAAVLAGLGFGILLVAVIANALLPAPAGWPPRRHDGNVDGHRRPDLLPVRVRLRGHQRAADHRGCRRDGADPPRAAVPAAQPARAVRTAVPRRRRRRLAAAEPGVYARHNAVDTPALLPDGTPERACRSRRSWSPVGRSGRPTSRHSTSRRLEAQVDELTGEPLEDSVGDDGGERR